VTHDQILALTAGPDLDRLISTTLDLPLHDENESNNPMGGRWLHYSTDLSDAWRVIHWLARRVTTFHIRAALNIHLTPFVPLASVEATTTVGQFKGYLAVEADTLPLAICRAALLASLPPEHTP
jgi:hypothetical protein